MALLKTVLDEARSPGHKGPGTQTSSFADYPVSFGSSRRRNSGQAGRPATGIRFLG